MAVIATYVYALFSAVYSVMLYEVHGCCCKYMLDGEQTYGVHKYVVCMSVNSCTCFTCYKHV